jgi:hypothetical protein
VGRCVECGAKHRGALAVCASCVARGGSGTDTSVLPPITRTGGHAVGRGALVVLILAAMGIAGWFLLVRVPEQRETAQNRAAVLAAMRQPSRFLNKLVVPNLIKYGIPEWRAKGMLGEPYKEWRDGTGSHFYLWGGNGVAIIAEFRNEKCSDYSVLDEEDLAAMAKR